ncbi:MAG: FHA domain-containing protein [Pseudomonadota bacterium]
MSALPKPQPAWCLRFLSGALKGRTMALKPGANTLGSAPGCEVMLPGSEVLPRHLVIHVGELVISVQAAGGGEAHLNGQPLGGQRRSLVAGDIVAVGPIELELDRSYPEGEADDPMFAWSPSMLDEDGPRPPRPAPAGRPWWRGGATALLLALAGLTAVAAWQRGGKAADANAPHLDLAALEKTLAAFPEVEAVAAPGGQVLLKGFVETRLRRQALAQAVRSLGGQVAMSVHAADDIVEQARRYVDDPGIALTYAGRGQLVASGVTDSDAVRQKLRRLGEDLHPNVLVSDRVQYREPKPRANADEAATQWAAWQALLPARMVSITEDGRGGRHIQLANGTRYYEGSVLRSGAELKSIGVDQLTVSAGAAPRTP